MRQWRFRRFLRRAPRPPENVRFVRADGTEIPVDCVFEGYRAGTAHWKVVQPMPRDVVGMRAEMLPSWTSITAAMPE